MTDNQGWRDIATAPWEERVIVKTQSAEFEAVLLPYVAVNNQGEWVDQWQATQEGMHPACWSDGCCWEVNLDLAPSEPPIAWKPAPDTP